MIPVTNQADVNFFLSVSTGQRVIERLFAISAMRSSLDADGLSTYKIIADPSWTGKFEDRLKGQAKIRTSWSILFLDLCVEPVLFVRQLSGI
jgi:hypothetical protein